MMEFDSLEGEMVRGVVGKGCSWAVGGFCVSKDEEKGSCHLTLSNWVGGVRSMELLFLCYLPYVTNCNPETAAPLEVGSGASPGVHIETWLCFSCHCLFLYPFAHGHFDGCPPPPTASFISLQAGFRSSLPTRMADWRTPATLSTSGPPALSCSDSHPLLSRLVCLWSHLSSED